MAPNRRGRMRPPPSFRWCLRPLETNKVVRRRAAPSVQSLGISRENRSLRLQRAPTRLLGAKVLRLLPLDPQRPALGTCAIRQALGEARVFCYVFSVLFASVHVCEAKLGLPLRRRGLLLPPLPSLKIRKWHQQQPSSQRLD